MPNLAPSAIELQRNPTLWQSATSDPNFMKLLSLLGLKSAQDVDKFLKSAAGKSVISEIEKNVAVKEAIARSEATKVRDFELLKLRVESVLFLFALEEKAQASEQCAQIVDEQQKKQREADKATSIKPSATPDKDKLEKEASVYEKMMEKTQAYQQELQKQEQELIRTIADLSIRITMQPGHVANKEHQERVEKIQQQLKGNQATQALIHEQIRYLLQAQQNIRNQILSLAKSNTTHAQHSVSSTLKTSAPTLSPVPNTPVPDFALSKGVQPHLKPDQAPVTPTSSAPTPFSTIPQKK